MLFLWPGAVQSIFEMKVPQDMPEFRQVRFQPVMLTRSQIGAALQIMKRLWID